ncbi:Alpha/Beta hydrolase protein [Boletus reticuloceps]|uniref:Alpha/Beta hydrolase protein n=1 Tax=Boletus reticuloceps TaxID=495285 RepID=A0A8I2YQJ5_9AGAM|nr:Alpha/Beta hydrolase protein [Boletus reticuloceps]
MTSLTDHILNPLIIASVLLNLLFLCRSRRAPRVSHSKPRSSVGEKALHTRDYFYVGGSYVPHGSSVVHHGQMYVEHLTPARVTRRFPVLFIHGNGMTGTSWLNTPDGRPGWSDYFLNEGYEVYIVDQPARGRSAWQPEVDGATSTFTTRTIESRFTATKEHGLWPQATLHTQWPGSGSRGDPIFDAFYRSVVPGLTSAVEMSELMKVAGSALLDKIGPAVVVTHSQSGYLGWILGDARPNLVKGIVALEPNGPPFRNAIFMRNPARVFGLTDIPLTFNPPVLATSDLRPFAVFEGENYTSLQQSFPPRRLVHLAQIPVLLVTSEAGYHAVYEDFTVQFLQEAGVNVTHIRLESVGIRGNGHMFFMELNSDQIAAEIVEPWIRRSLDGTG